MVYFTDGFSIDGNVIKLVNSYGPNFRFTTRDPLNES